MTTKDFYGWEIIVGMTKDGEPITEIETEIDLNFVQVMAPQIDYFEFVKGLQSLNLNQEESSWHTAEQDQVPVVKPEH